MNRPGRSPDRWHRGMYDAYSAGITLESPRFRKLAALETRFLIRVLELPDGASILDVPCGTGRHAARLAKAGYRVTGVDINPGLLAIARRKCRGLGVHLERGDMARLGRWRGRFDAVVNMYSSFGYFPTDAANERVLRGLAAALKPGGRIALHLMNPDWLRRRYRPLEWRLRNGLFHLRIRRFDPADPRYHEGTLLVMDERTGKVRRYYHRVRLYAPAEMRRLLRKAGLRNVRVYGDTRAGPLRGSRLPDRFSHPFYVAEKPLRL